MGDLFLPDHYKELEVNQNDMMVASLAWGFTLGFGFLTTWVAIKQTMNTKYRWTSPYIWMIWLEILVCLIFGIICFMHLGGVIPGSFAFYFSILTTWALQVQFLLQIIINRISVIMVSKRHANIMKWSVAALITAVNISVYCIWVPARLQISERYIFINEIWDRTEKVIYLLVDGWLNWFFISTVKERLVSQGIKKYDRLVRFNTRIVLLSLSMDVLIISTMSLKNGFVYMQFHPLAYMVKLNIEMSMASLILRIAKERTGQPGVGTRTAMENTFELSSYDANLSQTGRQRPTRNSISNALSSVKEFGNDSGVGSTSTNNNRRSAILVRKTQEIIIDSHSININPHHHHPPPRNHLHSRLEDTDDIELGVRGGGISFTTEGDDSDLEIGIGEMSDVESEICRQPSPVHYRGHMRQSSMSPGGVSEGEVPLRSGLRGAQWDSTAEGAYRVEVTVGRRPRMEDGSEETL